MGFGMVRSIAHLRRLTALFAAFAVWATACFAQSPPVPSAPTAADEAAISKECITPTMTIRGDVPLPVVSTALRERKMVKILTIGGSARAGADPQNGGYNAAIQRMLETSLKGVAISIIDQGISGELAKNAGERIKAEVALNPPDLVIWQVGTSDAFSNIAPEEFEADLTETVRWLKEHNTDVVLIGLHFIRNLASDSHYQAIRQSVHRVATAEKVLRIGRYEVGEWLEKSKAADGPPDEFAMTEAGYTCMAEYVARAIAAAAFEKRLRVKPPN